MLAAAVNGIPIFFGGFYLRVQTLNLGAESPSTGQSLHLGSRPSRDQAAHSLRVYQLDPLSSDASSFDLGNAEDGTSYLDAWR